MYSLDQVRCFVAVAEELHFGRAAARLSMTQPPLSRQLQKLEREVGVLLLERTNRSTRLTQAGAAFLVEARRLLAAAEDAPEVARRIAAGRAGRLRVGFTAVSAFGVLGRVLTALDAALPGVDVALHELVTADQLDALRRRELDLALARPTGEAAAGDFDRLTLAREDLLLATPSRHPLARRRAPVPVEALAGETLVAYSPERARYFHDLVTGVLHDVRPRVGHQVTQVHTVVALVAAGRGVALVPASARRLGVPGVRLRELVGLPERPVRLDAVWRRDDTDPLLTSTIECLRTLML